MLNAAADEVVSSTSSMCRTAGSSEGSWESEELIDVTRQRISEEESQEFSDTTESSESESEASRDDDNDDPEDKDFWVKESSSSSQSDDIRDDLDDVVSCPAEQQNNEERKKESNVGVVPQLAVEGEKYNKGRTYSLRSRSLSKPRKKKLNRGDCSSPILLSDEEEPKSVSEEDCKADHSVQNAVQKDAVKKHRRTRNRILKDSEFLKFVVDSIITDDDHIKLTSSEEKEQVPVKKTLPLKFRFEDEEPQPPEKEEWEKEIEHLFAAMDMCISQSHIGFTNSSVLPMQSEETAGCQMGNHHLVLDEEIGLICKICSHVHLESKYIFPTFAQRNRGRHERKYFGESPSLLDVDGFRFYDSSTVHDPAIYGEGTVWDLVPLSAKATMYPHQRGGFEFMWKNIAGDITLEKLREPPSGSRGGCIISHPPGTGKTHLTIVFLQAYLKQFPKSRPVIIVPSNLLPNWEAEFQKWEADIPFHNLNSKDFSFKEDDSTVRIFRCLSRTGRKNSHHIRMVKLRSWAKSTSVLGISCDLFKILTREYGDFPYAKEIREILLKLPGLLVLEEGHTARNEQSLVWKALNKVETEKRIILSGTPFQNNIKELYNTFCVVSPKFAAEFEQKWTSLSSCIDKNVRALEELRDMIAPLVHKCSENVKKDSLPGIRDTVIHLKPTDLQKELLKRIPEHPGSFYEQNLMSLISVHPSLVAKKNEFCDLESQLKEKECRLDPNIGVKMKFVVELIRLCGGLKERVIIFSQLLDPLNLIKEQLHSLFGWTLGREILYMDGKLDVKQRQISINSLNDPKGDVKVLLASIKACSEGISLIGASRVVLLDVLWNPSVEQQAISRAYRNGQTKFVHVYCPVTSKWEVDKIEQQTRKKYHSDILLSRNEVNTGKMNAVSEDTILDAMVQHESLRHMFEKLSRASRVILYLFLIRSFGAFYGPKMKPSSFCEVLPDRHFDPFW
ncbi:SNF2 domain-containing protein CLASSY 4-like [Lycium ferocissimum]|uniref:SNF2 domain-containing protein CLASSY 4-like n=1 Tax=Lycium ferocissimum TaxID=112874 RepID=UPI002815A4AE|nr:SNF2 domain-containing protein CLASSY 4-like [Lycium ferocissimum]